MMVWEVTDDGRISMRMRAEGIDAVETVKTEAERFIANVVGDMVVNAGIGVVTDELRFSISKTRPEVTVTWRARVPRASAPTTREYMTKLSEGLMPPQGEIVGGEVVDGTPDQ